MKSLTGERRAVKEMRHTTKGEGRGGKEKNVFLEKQLKIWRRKCQENNCKNGPASKKTKICCHESQRRNAFHIIDKKSRVVKRFSPNEFGILEIIVSTWVRLQYILGEWKVYF